MNRNHMKPTDEKLKQMRIIKRNVKYKNCTGTIFYCEVVNYYEQNTMEIF